MYSSENIDVGNWVQLFESRCIYIYIYVCVCVCVCVYIYIYMYRGAQITGAMSWRLNFVPWHIMFVGTQYRPFFMSTSWRFECGCGFYILGKSVHRCLPIIDRLTLHLFYNQHPATCFGCVKPSSVCYSCVNKDVKLYNYIILKSTC